MNSAHWHLLFNHLPLLGTAFGALLLLFAFWRKSEELRRVSLGVFVLAGVSAIPVYLTGEPAEGIVEHMPGVAKVIIEQHERAALLALSLAIATGVVALAAMLFAWRGQQFASRLTLATLFLALATFVLMARAANLGGQIRHTEIRLGAPTHPETEVNQIEQKSREREEH